MPPFSWNTDTYRDHIFKLIELGANNQSAAPAVVTPTAAPTAATATTGGSIAAGTYLVGYSWTQAGGETAVSPTASIVATGATSTITITVPALPAGATGVNYYISQPGGSVLYLAGSNAATSLTVTAIPATTVAQAPTANTTGPAITYIPIHSNAVALAPEVQTIVTQGTTQKYESALVDKLDLTITNNVLADALAQLYLKAGTLVGTELTRSFFDGDFSNAPLLAVRITTTANRMSDGRLTYMRYIFPKCNVKSGDEVGAFAVAPASLSGTVVLTAQKTATDILGNAIALPTGVNGAFYYRTVALA